MTVRTIPQRGQGKLGRPQVFPPGVLDTQEVRDLVQKEFYALARNTTQTPPPTVAKTQIGAAASIKRAIVISAESDEASLDPRYPATRIGFASLNEILVDLAKIQIATIDGLPDPAAIRAAIQTRQPQVILLPGSGYSLNPGVGVIESWRTRLQRSSKSIMLSTRSLEETLFFALTQSGPANIGPCPGRFCKGRNDSNPPDETLTRVDAACKRSGEPIHISDALRLSKEVNPVESNRNALGRLRIALMHLALLDNIRTAQSLSAEERADLAIITMHPLAFSGGPASGLRAAFKELIPQILQIKDPAALVMGLYTQGTFLDHARALESLGQGTTPAYPVQTLIELPNNYLKSVLGMQADSVWGKETYFGQPFIYITKKRVPVAFTLPIRGTLGKDSHRATNYPEMARALQLLDDTSDDRIDGRNQLAMIGFRYGRYSRASPKAILQQLGGKTP